MQGMTRATGQTWLGWVVATGASIFVVTGLAAHVLERDHDIVRSSLSSYAVSSFGYIMEIGFFALALAHAALLVALVQRTLARSPLVRVGLIGLGVEALAVLTVALFPANGLGYVNGVSIHGTAATIAFIVFPPAAII
nr:DUF998 domain-containing protein [Ktedonobacterales bacterium]